LGHDPGLNLIYVHLNRVIREHDLNVIYVTGPGHGGPGLVANTYLEGTYTERYPNVAQDEQGMKRLFTQFSFPGGIPSHVAPETPGSINEGGELGYSLAHAYGAALDNPDHGYPVLIDRLTYRRPEAHPPCAQPRARPLDALQLNTQSARSRQLGRHWRGSAPAERQPIPSARLQACPLPSIEPT
jgi:XFP N-terminal domain